MCMCTVEIVETLFYTGIDCYYHTTIEYYIYVCVCVL